MAPGGRREGLVAAAQEFVFGGAGQAQAPLEWTAVNARQRIVHLWQSEDAKFSLIVLPPLDGGDSARNFPRSLRGGTFLMPSLPPHTRSESWRAAHHFVYTLVVTTPRGSVSVVLRNAAALSVTVSLPKPATLMGAV